MQAIERYGNRDETADNINKLNIRYIEFRARRKILLKKLIKALYSSAAVIAAAAAICACNKTSTDTTETSTTIESTAEKYDSQQDAEQSHADSAETAEAKAAHDDAAATADNEATDTDVSDKAVITAVIHKDEKFDCADLDLDADDFAKAGFAFGDSVDIAFSNGETMTDIPYFNGYYVKTGEPVMVAYHGHDYVVIAHNNADLWTPFKLEEGMTVTVTLNTSGKYLATQEAVGQNYSMERADFASDEIFANFRALKGGRLKADYLYRGTSPVDNSRKRAAYADKLIEEHNIACIIDLADSDEEMHKYFSKDSFTSDYAKKLYEEGRTVTLNMNSSYSKDKYKQSVVKGLRKLIEVGGPAYIHCLEGKDRTGFVCMLIEALAGASYDEMRDDYMITYANYYNITADGTPDRYEAVVDLYFDTFMEYLSGESDDNKLHELSYVDSAKQYLIDGGMTEAEIDELLTLITE